MSTRLARPTAAELDRLNEEFELAPPEEILEWAWHTLGPEIAASSSFQTQSVPLLHLISRVCPGMRVLFLDTGFHFPETLSFRDDLVGRFGLNLEVLRPSMDRRELFARHGDTPYRTDPDLCCYVNKVEPMQRALQGMRGWVSGVRRDQTKDRNRLAPLQEAGDGIIRVHPMLTWTSRDVQTYMDRHRLPVHPLLALGYPSVGCVPCTRPVGEGGAERSGRWHGTTKNECGLHTDLLKRGGES